MESPALAGEAPKPLALRREAGEAGPQFVHGEAERAGRGEAVDGLLCLGLADGEAEGDGRGLLSAGEDGGGEGAGGGGGGGHRFVWFGLLGA